MLVTYIYIFRSTEVAGVRELMMNYLLLWGCETGNCWHLPAGSVQAPHTCTEKPATWSMGCTRRHWTSHKNLPSLWSMSKKNATKFFPHRYGKYLLDISAIGIICAADSNISCIKLLLINTAESLQYSWPEQQVWLVNIFLTSDTDINTVSRMAWDSR